MTEYNKTSHTVFHHRYHIVWVTKYRYKVLQGTLRMRVREIIAQAADQMGIKIVNGVLSADHIHVFVEIPPTSPSATSSKLQKGEARARYSKNSLRFARNIGAVTFGEGDSLVQPAAT